MSRWLRMLNLGLSDKLFLPFVSILLLSVIASSFSTVWIQRQSDAEQQDLFAGRLGSVWRASVEEMWQRNEIDQVRALFRQAASRDSLLLVVALLDNQSNVIASSSGDQQPKAAEVKIRVAIAGPGGKFGTLVASYARTFEERSWGGLIAAIVVAGLSTIIIGGFLYLKVLEKVLLKRIRSTANAASAIANRDLSLRLDDRGDDELAQLSTAFNQMAGNLSELLKGISAVAVEINGRAGEVSRSAVTQSESAQVQSSQVSQLRTSMETIADQTRQIASTAEEVVRIADGTRASTDNGVSVTDQSRGIMDEIARDNSDRVDQISELKRRADQIGDVMQFIEQVADQTKLIAFNASIEAAGAGEMGRRFDVVAREIRRLAENVSESAGQIRIRIQDVQQGIETISSKSLQESEKVRSGSAAALNTVTILHEIRGAANTTTEQIHEISESISRQNASTGELVDGLRSIDVKAAQLNRESGELAEVAAALNKLSVRLKELASGFTLDPSSAA